MTEEEKVKGLSRRSFLRSTGLTVGGFAIGSVFGGFWLGGPKEVVKEVEKEVAGEIHTEAMQFFTRKEDFNCLSAAVECIYPEDESGPGAIGLGVPYYIDRQMTTPWASNAKDYHKGPFEEGATPLTRNEIVLQGVRKLNEVSKEKHELRFVELNKDEQISTLQEFEAGEVEMELVSSAAFFALLKQLTIEGCYSDPVYGGNRGMKGWEMLEFPGAYMSYTDVIESKEFVKKTPQSLSDHM